MMNIPSKSELTKIREAYPAGASVELVSMEDPYCKMPAGLKGVVDHVDDVGTIHVHWENGSSLGVAYEVDEIRLV